SRFASVSSYCDSYRVVFVFFYSSLFPHHPQPTLFPYTTLFRSLNIETSSESKFVTYANFPDGSMAIELGDDPAATVPIDVKTPVVALRVYMETFEFTFAT